MPRGQTEAEISGRQHGTDLRRQSDSEIGIVYHTKSCSKVKVFQQVKLVLHIQCRSFVTGCSGFCAFWGFQIVIPVFDPSVQRVVVWQTEDSLQLSHHTLLVTLQFALSRLHQYGIPLTIQFTILLAF